MLRLKSLFTYHTSTFSLKPFNPEHLISRCGEKFGFEINTLLVRLHGVYPRKKISVMFGYLVFWCSYTYWLNCVSKGNTRTPCSGQMISNQSVIKYFIRSVCWIFFSPYINLACEKAHSFGGARRWLRRQIFCSVLPRTCTSSQANINLSNKNAYLPHNTRG